MNGKIRSSPFTVSEKGNPRNQAITPLITSVNAWFDNVSIIPKTVNKSPKAFRSAGRKVNPKFSALFDKY